jgi:hypothetical protein
MSANQTIQETIESLDWYYESDTNGWDADDDCPVPTYVLVLYVSDPRNHRVWLASVGGVGVNSLNDAWLEELGAELIGEAKEVLLAELEATAHTYEHARVTQGCAR